MSDLTTLGVKFGYAVATANGTMPTAFTQLQRCKTIGAITLSQDNIDVTALEDSIKKYAEGLQDTGGKIDVTFGLSDDVITEQETYLTASATAKTENKEIWHEVYFPGLTKAFYFIASPGTKIGMPDISGGAAATITQSLVINEYKGLDTAIEPTVPAGI